MTWTARSSSTRPTRTCSCPNQSTDGECLAALVNSVQFGSYATDQGTPDANFGAAVDGNYGFGDGCTGTLDATDPANPVCNGGTFEPLAADSYLVSIEIPDDASGDPKYQVTSEEDINIARGDQVVPQVPPPSCAGALHTVTWPAPAPTATRSSSATARTAARGSDRPRLGSQCGRPHEADDRSPETPVDNATFVDMGGSPYEGTPKARCDTKLVDLNNGKSIVPMFNVFTDVPIPSRLRGLVVDDLNYSTDKRTHAVR